MKKGSTLFLQAVICLMGAVVLTWLLYFPQTEGRAKDLDLVSIYLNSVIIYVYIASVPFFVGLYQAVRLLGYIEKGKAFSKKSVMSLRNIKYSALAVIGFTAPVIPYLSIMARKTHDDPAGAIMIEVVIIFTSAVIATAAGVFQKLVQNGAQLKNENDLTV